jgi:hypothetical protein
VRRQFGDVSNAVLPPTAARTADIASGRDVLRTMLDGPIRFTPIVEERRVGYAFDAC